jgi:hypothetical protein
MRLAIVVRSGLRASVFGDGLGVLNVVGVK